MENDNGKSLTQQRIEEQVRAEQQAGQEDEGSSRKILIGIVVFIVLVLVGLAAMIWALTLPSTDTAKIRDIFIIIMALESLLLGAALIILIIQLARLTNLLQNEVKPILESTNETVNTLRGTTAFLSDNLVEPVIKLNQYLAALTQLLTVIGIGRGRPKDRKTNP